MKPRSPTAPTSGSRRSERGSAVSTRDLPRSLPRVPVVACAAAALLPLAASGCFDRGYPLGSGGSVDVRTDVAGALIAADLVDIEGKGALPRQVPFQTGVTLTLSEGGEAANGGFVDVRVEPPEALGLATDDAEDADEPTCKAKDGTFRCTATAEGIARFVLTSEADWSGVATLVVTWADQRKEATLEVLPAGLPTTSKNFEVIASGLADTDHVLPTYSALGCTTIDTLPADLGSKWRPGKIRSREAFVRASAPPDQPGVLANAPVIVESLSSEAELSLDPTCEGETRVTRLRMLLGPTGESQPFHFCFSDIGGIAEFSVSSGLLSISPEPRFDVDAEPRVLRVAAITPTVEQGASGVLFEVTAFNTDLQRIAMPVDIESSEPDVLQLFAASDTLSPEGIDPTGIFVTAASTGTAILHVRPRLFKEPDCTSNPVTVVEAPPIP